MKRGGPEWRVIALPHQEKTVPDDPQDPLVGRNVLPLRNEGGQVSGGARGREKSRESLGPLPRWAGAPARVF